LGARLVVPLIASGRTGKTGMNENESNRVGPDGPSPTGSGPGRRRSVGRAIMLAVAAGGAALAIWGAIDHFINWPVHHFGVVKPGVLYRSAQPTESGWRALKKEYGIRAVVDLRSDEPEKQWSILQRDFCKENGIKLIRVPIGPDRLTDEQFKVLMGTLADPNWQPALVHCELGKLRTGVVVAAYRMAVDGWSRERALAESRQYRPDLNRGYEEYLRQLERRLAARPARTSGAGAARAMASGN
jgi:hypothetical protein